RSLPDGCDGRRRRRHVVRLSGARAARARRRGRTDEDGRRFVDRDRGGVVKIITIASRDDAELLARYHAGIYWDEFAARQEPLAVWERALWGEVDYELTIRLAVDGDDLLGGISFERYPESRCGLITYMVVAPQARRRGLGKRMQADAIATMLDAGARAVFGEV